ncbi:MAG: O-antigen ligase family protein [Clostridiales bacterium]|nr:O-antigen ligase family protein [Clostridiales bacterium]
MNLISKIALLWGIVLSIYHFYKIVLRKPNKIEILIYIFLAFTLILNLIFYRSIDNLKIWIVNLIILTGVFFIEKDKSKELLNNELNIISNLFIGFTFVFSTASTIMYIFKISFVLFDTTYGLNQGLYVYKNTLAISAAISFVLSFYCYLKSCNKLFKCFYIINAVIQIFNVIYSGGRSAILLLLAIPFVFIFLYIKNNIFRLAIIIVPTITCIGLFAKFHERLYDFLSSRNELWYSAYLLFKNNLLTGVGNSNLVERVYSMRLGVVLPGIEAGGLHNIYLQIITANGLISFIIFISLIIMTICTLTKKIDSMNKKDKLINGILLTLIFGILFVNLFESNLVYIASFISIIFWSYLSYFYSITTNNSKKVP